MRNISVCIAIQKMAETISDESVRIALSNTAAQALKEAVHLFATVVDAGSKADSRPEE
jgi:hypothetical protein